MIYYIIGVYIINWRLRGRFPVLASEALTMRNQFISPTLREDCNASCSLKMNYKIKQFFKNL